MNKKLKEIPNFHNEDEEREFWGNHDSSEYIDFSKLRLASFPNLQRTAQLHSDGAFLLHLSPEDTKRVTQLAKERNTPVRLMLQQMLHQQLYAG